MEIIDNLIESIGSLVNQIEWGAKIFLIFIIILIVGWVIGGIGSLLQKFGLDPHTKELRKIRKLLEKINENQTRAMGSDNPVPLEIPAEENRLIEKRLDE